MNNIPEVKSLRWLANMFPFVSSPSDETDKISNCIHLYCSAGADKIEELVKEKQRVDSIDNYFISLDLSKVEFIMLIMSYAPELSDISRFQDGKLGYYNGSYDKWHWSESSLRELSDDDLIGLFVYLRSKERLK